MGMAKGWRIAFRWTGFAGSGMGIGMRISSVVAILLLLLGCGSDDDGAAQDFVFQELADQGLTRYVGAASPVGSADVNDGTVFEFDTADGPICLHGAVYRAAVRRTDSPDLHIYLQGGGACSSAICLVTFADTESLLVTGVPPAGILSTTLAANPVRDWNVVYAPYCDGSLMAGDVSHDVDNDGVIEHQRGLANLSAVLDLAKAEFPRPRRIMLSGVSAGGFATFTALPLVRYHYPDAEILVVNDAGVGIGRSTIDGVRRMAEEWNSGSGIPQSCEGCFDRGHLMPLLGWQLERDDNVRAAMISSFGDFVITATFLGIPEEAFETALLDESGAIQERFPDRFKRFLFAGTKHTTIPVDSTTDLRDAIDLDIDIDIELLEQILGSFDETNIRGVTVAEWVTDMVEEGAWNDLVDETEMPAQPLSIVRPRRRPGGV
jgi:hypothetical protein